MGFINDRSYDNSKAPGIYRRSFLFTVIPVFKFYYLKQLYFCSNKVI
jgi:hypothetical protein